MKKTLLVLALLAAGLVGLWYHVFLPYQDLTPQDVEVAALLELPAPTPHSDLRAFNPVLNGVTPAEGTTLLREFTAFPVREVAERVYRRDGDTVTIVLLLFTTAADAKAEFARKLQQQVAGLSRYSSVQAARGTTVFRSGVRAARTGKWFPRRTGWYDSEILILRGELLVRIREQSARPDGSGKAPALNALVSPLAAPG